MAVWAQWKQSCEEPGLADTETNVWLSLQRQWPGVRLPECSRQMEESEGAPLSSSDLILQVGILKCVSWMYRSKACEFSLEGGYRPGYQSGSKPDR